MSHESLDTLRQRIDTIDLELQKLINERAAIAQQVAVVKQKDRDFTDDIVYYRPEREAQILRRVMQRNKGPIGKDHMARLFREIMSLCLALEHPMRVAFLGPRGTFTEAAALKHFGHTVTSAPMATIDDVFREVEAGAANYGVVPIENSTEGAVTHTLDNFFDSPLTICGEVELRIHHHLLARSTQKPEEICKIVSHQQSLAQCRKWLDQHWPNVQRIPVNSNAEAAQLVLKEENTAAIAGEMAADHYGLQTLVSNIEDHAENTTRFLIIGNQQVPASGEDKTSLMVATRNQPGALYHVLAPFHNHDISLTRIETRPSKTGPWSYIFFIDLEGHLDNQKVKEALQDLGKGVVELKSLGSYPRCVF